MSSFEDDRSDFVRRQIMLINGLASEKLELVIKLKKINDIANDHDHAMCDYTTCRFDEIRDLSS